MAGRDKSNKRGKNTEIQVEGGQISVSEHETREKGFFSYSDKGGRLVAAIEKPIGVGGWDKRARGGHKPPAGRRQMTPFEKKIITAKTDILAKRSLSGKGEPSYEKVAGLLPPLGFPYTFLGDREYPHRPSPRVDWDGSIREFLGFGINGKPADWARGDREKIKYGLLDGYLPAVQFVSCDEEAGVAWEEIASARACKEAGGSLLVFIRFRVMNPGRKTRSGSASIFFNGFTQVSGTDATVADKIPKPDFYPEFTGHDVEQPEWLWVSDDNDCTRGKVYPFSTVERPFRLKAGEETSVYLILSYTRPLKQGSFARLVPGLNFYRALYEVKRDWDAQLEKGMVVETPESRVDNACKASLIQGFMTVAGSDVRYAVAGRYSNARAMKSLDGLPIAIIHPAECFAEWGHLEEAGRYLEYFLNSYINTDGSATYSGGTGAKDYGMLLYAACRYYMLNKKDSAWIKKNLKPVSNICGFIMRKRNEGLKKHPPGSPLHGLISMISCDDLRHLKDFYNYAGDACCWLGLEETGKMLMEASSGEKDGKMAAYGRKLRGFAKDYKRDITKSIGKLTDRSSSPVFVPIYPDRPEPFKTMTDARSLAGFANFLWYPCLLYSGILGENLAEAVVRYREKRGGELAGTSRLAGLDQPLDPRLDDWPIATMGWALVNLDMPEKFLLAFYGDMAHHRMRDIFTAYEQVGIAGIEPGGGRRITAGYNINSTMAAARMARHMLVFEERDRDVAWLNRASPRAWLEDGKITRVRNAPTRWGRMSFRIESDIGNNRIFSLVDFDGPRCASLKINLRLRHPANKKFRAVSVNGREWGRLDAEKEIIILPCSGETRFSVEARY